MLTPVVGLKAFRKRGLSFYDQASFRYIYFAIFFLRKEERDGSSKRQNF
jgi:hypothetical protein